MTGLMLLLLGASGITLYEQLANFFVVPYPVVLCSMIFSEIVGVVIIGLNFFSQKYHNYHLQRGIILIYNR
jgi:hypothetical protein